MDRCVNAKEVGDEEEKMKTKKGRKGPSTMFSVAVSLCNSRDLKALISGFSFQPPSYSCKCRDSGN